MHGHDTAHAAVFVNDDGKIVAGLLHILEKHIGFHIFRDEIRLFRRRADNRFGRRIVRSEKFLDVQNADNVVGILAADRIEAVAGFGNRFFPLGKRVLFIKNGDIASVRAYFGNRNIVEFKYILNHFVFHAVDGAPLASGIEHHTDFLLGHGIPLLIRVDMEKPEQSVCRFRQNPDKRCKYAGDESLRSSSQAALAPARRKRC